MSKTTKRKHVMKEIMDDDYELPKENQSIVKVIGSKGNNLHEVEGPLEKYLVSMPTKFRKNIWVKRGDYVLVEPIAEGDKVKGEIIKILTSESIKYLKKSNVWPVEFLEKDKDAEQKCDDADIFVNTNRNREETGDVDTSDSSESSSCESK